MLHGAGGVARSALDILREEADRHRLLLMAPKSTGASWDVLAGGYGPDVRNIDRLLSELSARYRVRGYTVGGFSDGASYALSLGLVNGDVFDSVIAFSPGFEAAELANGRPRFFISHGTGDRVLPIDRCSRRIVPALEDEGYEVAYHEFEGGHAVPSEMQRRAVEWLGRPPAS
jgi:predicted esterase